MDRVLCWFTILEQVLENMVRPVQHALKKYIVSVIKQFTDSWCALVAQVVAKACTNFVERTLDPWELAKTDVSKPWNGGVHSAKRMSNEFGTVKKSTCDDSWVVCADMPYNHGVMHWRSLPVTRPGTELILTTPVTVALPNTFWKACRTAPTLDSFVDVTMILMLPPESAQVFKHNTVMKEGAVVHYTSTQLVDKGTGQLGSSQLIMAKWKLK